MLKRIGCWSAFCAQLLGLGPSRQPSKPCTVAGHVGRRSCQREEALREQVDVGRGAVARLRGVSMRAKWGVTQDKCPTQTSAQLITCMDV